MSVSSTTLQISPVRMMRRLATRAIEVLYANTDRAETQRNAIAAFLIRVASAGLLYISQAILARWMGSFEFGIYVFVWTWVLVLGGLSHAGLGLAMIRLVPQLRETGKLGVLRGLLLGGRLFAVGLSTAVATLAGIALWQFPEVLAHHYVLPVFIALFCLPMATLTEVQDGVGRGQGWMFTALLPPYVLRPLLLLASMAAAVAAGYPATAVTAAFAAIAATWLTAIVQTVMIERKLARTLPQVPRSYQPGAWAAISLPLLVIGGCEMLLQNADILIVSRYMSPSDVAIYFAAAKTMSLIMFVHYAVGSAVANRFAALHARGDRKALEAFIRDAVNWTFWPSLAAALAILVLGKPLLSLFGPAFVSGYPVMAILAFGFLVRSAMGPSDFLLNMLGEQRRCARALMMAAAVSLVLNFALVPLWGLVGAAVATALALSTAAAMNYAAAREHLALDIAIWSNIRRR